MGDDMHARGVEPDEEWLVLPLRLIDEGKCVLENFIIPRFHPLRIERAGILDALLADFSPARLHRLVIGVARPGMEHVAWTDPVLERLRVVAMRRVFHRVEVI